MVMTIAHCKLIPNVYGTRNSIRSCTDCGALATKPSGFPALFVACTPVPPVAIPSIISILSAAPCCNHAHWIMRNACSCCLYIIDILLKCICNFSLMLMAT